MNGTTDYNELTERLATLLEKQDENYNRYAHDRSEFMNTLNGIMTSYAECQHEHLAEYIKHLDKATKSRDIAQENERIALKALSIEQEKTSMLIDIIKNMSSSSPSSSVSVNTIK